MLSQWNITQSFKLIFVLQTINILTVNYINWSWYQVNYGQDSVNGIGETPYLYSSNTSKNCVLHYIDRAGQYDGRNECIGHAYPASIALPMSWKNNNNINININKRITFQPETRELITSKIDVIRSKIYRVGNGGLKHDTNIKVVNKRRQMSASSRM